MPSGLRGGTLSIVANETSSNREFYVVGGTLRRDAASYVPRAADDALYREVSAGSLCYVLTSRQMGKSSLMVRTAARLRADGDAAVVLDLTEIGRNLTVEQWYKGLLVATGEQLGLEDELGAHWDARHCIGPMHRWLRAIREVALPRVRGRMVIFVDEIDAVRSLPFSTDEFFAGIRETFNRRAEAPELERLTFCLLGVASPSDLISDTRTTPFNIGRQIELGDFTRDEAVPLARGLARGASDGRLVLDRILGWTGGHPYLTQRLCQAVAASEDSPSPELADVVCDDLFLSRRARERDDNLLFVRDRLLRSEVDLAELLELYRRVRAGKRVPDDESSPLVSVLKLSGIARVEDGRLRVRNRIYEHVFDEEWARDAMPGAEVRRQRRAFSSGFRRATGAALLVLAVMAILVVDAWRSRGVAWEQRRIAVAEREMNSRLLYVAHMNLAYQALARGDDLRVAQILDDESTAERRGFEFYYLWRLVHGEAQTFYADCPVVDVEYSPDGARLAAGTRNSIVIWDVRSGSEVAHIKNGQDGGGFALGFSTDGSSLSVASSDGTYRTYDASSGALQHQIEFDHTGVATIAVAPRHRPGGAGLVTGDALGRVRLYDVDSGAEVSTVATNDGAVTAALLSNDGRLLVTGSISGAVAVWNTATGRRTATLAARRDTVYAAAFSPDDGRLAIATADGRVALLDVATGAETAVLRKSGGVVQVLRFSDDGTKIAFALEGRVEVHDLGGALIATHSGHRDQVLDLDFSPDGSTIASASVDQTVRTWGAVAAENPRDVLAGHAGGVYSVAYSPDGSLLATASFDGTAALWNSDGRKIRTFTGHTGYVHCVAFSPDGALLATGSADHTARVWSVATGELVATIDGFGERVFTLAFAPDGASLAVGCFDGTIRIWDVARRADARTLVVDPPGSVECVAYSPDGSLLAAGGESKAVELFDAKTGAPAGLIEGHDDWVDSLAFSPDGTRLATAGSYSDTTVAVWDVASRQMLYRLKGFSGISGFSLSSAMGPSGRANCVRFSPDGLTLAVATTDRTVKLFDVQTGQELSTIATPHTTQVYSLAFSPDGSTLATASEDMTVRLWRAAPRDEVLAYLETEKAKMASPQSSHRIIGSF